MSRQVFPLILLLIFLASDSALGAKRATTRRACNCHGNADSHSSRTVRLKDFPNYCLQRKYLDYPGDYDLWECLVYPNGCGDPTGMDEDLYYGFPTQGVPESCPNCESDAWGGKGAPPPHKFQPLDKDLAWKVIDAGLSAAGFNINRSHAEYHRILAGDVPSEITPNRNIDMIMVPVPFPITSSTRYLCMEIDQQSDPVDTIANPHLKKGNGHVLKLDYTVGGRNRKGFIWLQR